MKNLVITFIFLIASPAFSAEQNYYIPPQGEIVENYLKVIDNSVAVFKTKPWDAPELEDRVFHLIRLTAGQAVGVSKSRRFMITVDYERKILKYGYYSPTYGLGKSLTVRFSPLPQR